ncbi:hypothetical protein GF378_02305 [Candidatus Pacearchaeota archaeon]|nr:hypothetical protein [Candidatus Pacearchaeota archaeon]
MRRKIVEQGHNTLTVSLPKKWCDNHNLKGGEEIDVSEKGNCLLVSKESFSGTGKVSVDITGLDRSTIMLLIQSLYTYGYDSIEIKTSDAKAKWHWGDKTISLASIINQSVSRLIGAELVNSSKGSYKIQVISGELRESFDVVLKRIFLLIHELFDTFLQRYRKKDIHIIPQIELQYMQLRRFMNYLLRMLDKFGHEDAAKTTFYFGMIKSFSRIVESLKNSSGPPDNPLIVTKHTCNLIEDVKEVFDIYYNLFYKYDVRKISDLLTKRDLFKRKVYYENRKVRRDDAYLLGSMTQVVDSIIDLSELKMAIEHKD